MGPIALYTCLLNGATLALYHGSPLGRDFCKFVQVGLAQTSLHHHLLATPKTFYPCSLHIVLLVFELQYVMFEVA